MVSPMEAVARPQRRLVRSSASATTREHPSGRPWRFLLIDDEPDITWVLRALIRQDPRWVDPEVVEAGSAIEVLKAVGEATPDVLITGGNQPPPNGYEMTRLLRADGFTMPIVIFTAIPYAYSGQLAREVGADAYVLKGSCCELLDVVEGLLGVEPAKRTFATRGL